MVGEEIGALFVRIGADVTGLKTGLNESQGQLDGFRGKINGAIGSVLQFGAVLAGTAAFALVGALGASIDSMENTGHAAYDMSKAFGIGAAQADKWINAASLVGVSADEMGTVFKIFGKNVGEGNKKALESFKALHVAVKDGHGNIRPLNDILFDVADRLSKMKDGALKAAYGAQIFGRNYAVLLPLLDQGKKGIEEAMAIGDEYGANLTTKQVKAAEAAYEAHKKLDLAVRGVGNALAVAALPYVEKFTNWLTPNIPRVVALGQAFTNKVVPPISAFVGWLTTLGPDLKAVSDTVQALAPYLAVVGAAWVAWNVALLVTEGIQTAILALQFAAGIYAIVSKVGLWTAAQWLLNVALDANPIGVVILAIAALTAGFIYAYQHSATFRAIVNQVWGALKLFASTFWADVKPVFDWFLPILQQAWDLLGKVANAIGGVFSATGAPKGGPGNGYTKYGHYATGGIVPGSIGSPQWAVVHGGEAVLTPAQQSLAAKSGNTTYLTQNINGPNLSAADLAREMVWALKTQ